MGYQYHVIQGNVGREPEMRYLPNGTPVCSFTVAVNKQWTSADGEKKEAVTWVKCTCWRKLAEAVTQYVVKGMSVLVDGDDLTASSWTGQDGTAKATLELTARTVKFLSKSGEAQEAAAEDESGIPF